MALFALGAALLSLIVGWFLFGPRAVPVDRLLQDRIDHMAQVPFGGAHLNEALHENGHVLKIFVKELHRLVPRDPEAELPSRQAVTDVREGRCTEGIVCLTCKYMHLLLQIANFDVLCARRLSSTDAPLSCHRRCMLPWSDCVSGPLPCCAKPLSCCILPVSHHSLL